MNTNRIMAYIATVCLTTAIGFTTNMSYWSAGLFSAGLMIVLDHFMGGKNG